MKRNMIKGFLALALVGILAAPAFAASVTANAAWVDPTTHAETDVIIYDTAGGGMTKSQLKFSVGVQFFYEGETTAATKGNNFVLATNTTKGNKSYGTSSIDSKMYILKADGQATADNIPAPSSTTSFATDTWNEVGR